VVIDKARREKRFRPRAVRIDSTVVEADVRYPTASGLALDAARVLASEARKLLVKIGNDAGHVRDRSRAIGRRVRAMTRTLGGCQIFRVRPLGECNSYSGGVKV
jgi:transposase, IS5 family